MHPHECPFPSSQNEAAEAQNGHEAKVALLFSQRAICIACAIRPTLRTGRFPVRVKISLSNAVGDLDISGSRPRVARNSMTTGRPSSLVFDIVNSNWKEAKSRMQQRNHRSNRGHERYLQWSESTASKLSTSSSSSCMMEVLALAS